MDRSKRNAAGKTRQVNRERERERRREKERKVRELPMLDENYTKFS